MSNCREYTTEQALLDFAVGMVFDLGGEKLANLVIEHGLAVVEKGLKKLGVADAVEWLSRRLDDFCSFSEDTLVSTENGLEAISTLGISDYVLAYDETSGSIGYYPVVGVWAHKDPVVVRLTIDGEVIETTPDHPFYVMDGKWKTADELKVDGKVRRADGSCGVIESVEFVEQPEWMYNLTVDQAHTYFVGKGRWLVHNACRITIGRKWRARAFNDPRCRSGCEYVAEQIRQIVGGETKTILPKGGAPFLGGIGGGGKWYNEDWAYHTVVVKGGRVYDAFTGHQGLSIGAYKRLWRYAEAIDFGF
jgi:hypothetical protein